MVYYFNIVALHNKWFENLEIPDFVFETKQTTIWKLVSTSWFVDFTFKHVYFPYFHNCKVKTWSYS